MPELAGLIAHYGYAGLFCLLVLGIVGLPVPDEALLVLSGALVAQAKLHPALTFCSALAGSISGISISYAIGRSLGHQVIHRYGKYVHLTEDRFVFIKSWFDRVGHWLLVVGYFIPGVRHFTALIAGVSCVSFRSFAAFAYSGALLWVSTFLSIGYLVGDRWQEVLDLVHRYTLLVAAIAAVILVAAWLVRRRLLAAAKNKLPVVNNR